MVLGRFDFLLGSPTGERFFAAWGISLTGSIVALLIASLSICSFSKNSRSRSISESSSDDAMYRALLIPLLLSISLILRCSRRAAILVSSKASFRRGFLSDFPLGRFEFFSGKLSGNRNSSLGSEKELPASSEDKSLVTRDFRCFLIHSAASSPLSRTVIGDSIDPISTSRFSLIAAAEIDGGSV